MSELREWLFSNCSVCPTVVCCSVYNVNILGRDVYRIARRRALPAGAFVTYVEQAEPDATGFRLVSGGPVYMLSLTKREEGATPAGWPCAFLLDLPHGVHRCGLYEERPLVCRTYPAAMYQGVIQLRREVVCPVAVYDIGKVDLRHWRAPLLENRVERDIHEAFIAAWNRLVEAEPTKTFILDELLNYLMNFYSRTDELRPLDQGRWEQVRAAWVRLLELHQSPLQLAESVPPEATVPEDAALWTLAAGLRAALTEVVR
jgi:Fe-S-cluster containining protein